MVTSFSFLVYVDNLLLIADIDYVLVTIFASAISKSYSNYVALPYNVVILVPFVVILELNDIKFYALFVPYPVIYVKNGNVSVILVI